MLADFSFSDLVLYVPAEDGDGMVISAHVRPVTGQTAFHHDIVGGRRTDEERPLVAEAASTGQIVHGNVEIDGLEGMLRVTAIPVMLAGEVVAVMAQESPSSTRRVAGQLEQAYQEVFDRFAGMVATGRFPFPAGADEVPAYAPRVGDGAIVTDAAGVVTFVSPNAVSCLTRAGVTVPILGADVSDVGFSSLGARDALSSGLPASLEVDGARDLAVTVRALPLWDGDAISGVVVLMRDVSDLKRRDRMLVSKDATIREIHHRVKNNLQTVSSLLRIQGRRLAEPSARAAVEESVRRIRSIAIVHELLSADTRDDIRLNDVLRPIVRLVEEGLISPDLPVEITISGDGGVVASPVATSLAVVLTELLQNILEHAFPQSVAIGDEPARVWLDVSNDAGQLEVRLRDNGVGLGDDFDLANGESLGLSIVLALVRDELGGTLEMSAGSDAADRPGTLATIKMSADAGRETAP